jgi:hypothetical protein
VNINLNLFKMSNLDDFKVEELEQRLEMRKWSARSTTEYACTGGDCRGYIGAAVTF